MSMLVYAMLRRLVRAVGKILTNERHTEQDWLELKRAYESAKEFLS